MTRSLILAWLLAWFALPLAGAAVPPTDATPQVLVLLSMPPQHFRPDGNYAGSYADATGRAARRRAAAALARAHGLRMTTDWPMPALGLDCYVMDVPSGMQAGAVADQLSSEPGVAWAQAMNVFRPLGRDDAAAAGQPAARTWPLAELHQAATGRDVRIAIIDSGIQADHPDLREQFSDHLNFVSNHADTAELHGTAVAGIIAARADNRVGIAGVAPLSRIMALRACYQASPADTLCTSLSLALALSAALDHDADIINLSLGGPSDRLVQKLIESALGRGVAVVAAANRSVPDGGFPAALKGVIAVSDAPLPRPARAVAAPGHDVLTTLPGSRWGVVSGSSYAAAHVSGLLALIMDARSHNRSFTGRPRAPVAADLVPGADGRVDACATLKQAALSCGCACGPAELMDSVARH